MGIEKYNAECRKIVMKYATEWETIITRMGRWIGKLPNITKVPVSKRSECWNLLK